MRVPMDIDLGLGPSISSFFRLTQPPNADSPILVTELGIVIEVNPVQPLKAEIPIFSTVLGMVMFVKDEKP